MLPYKALCDFSLIKNAYPTVYVTILDALKVISKAAENSNNSMKENVSLNEFHIFVHPLVICLIRVFLSVLRIAHLRIVCISCVSTPF